MNSGWVTGPLRGPAGADGADGADGTDGADGAQGPQGPAGVAGTYAVQVSIAGVHMPAGDDVLMPALDDDGASVVNKAAATGAITVDDVGGLAPGDTLTVPDGRNTPKVFAHHNGDGTTTTKDSIDIGGAPTEAQLAIRVAAAINLANTAGECNITAVVDGVVDEQVNLTADEQGAFANLTITQLTTAAYTLAGMSGGLLGPIVGGPRALRITGSAFYAGAPIQVEGFDFYGNPVQFTSGTVDGATLRTPEAWASVEAFGQAGGGAGAGNVQLGLSSNVGFQSDEIPEGSECAPYGHVVYGMQAKSFAINTETGVALIDEAALLSIDASTTYVFTTNITPPA